MNTLESAIYAALSGDAAITDLLASNKSIYAYSAPENAHLPVVVFYEQTGSSVYTLAARAYDNWLYGVKAITQSDTMNVAGNIDAAIDALLGDAQLTVGANKTMMCRREASITPYSEFLAGVRYNHVGSSYRIYTIGDTE